MKSFAGFMAIVGLAIFLTKGSDVKRSCKNDAVAYFVASQYAKEAYAKEHSLDVASITVPPIYDVDIQHRYLGGCRHMMRAFLEVDATRKLYDISVLGFREDGGKHVIESLEFHETLPQ